MGISCKHGVCKSFRGILGFYPCHAHLYYIVADCGTSIRYGTAYEQAYSGPCAVEDPEKNSAKLAANFEDSCNQRGLYFPRRAHRTKTACSQKPPRFRGQGQDECLQSRVKMDRPKTGRSARWGAACAPCAAAKTRCIRTQSSGPQQCDRCRSLEKDCVGQTLGPRKKRQAKHS